MTQKTLSRLMLIVIVSIISFKGMSSDHTVKATTNTSQNQGLTSEPVKMDPGISKMPFFPPPESKEAHGKPHGKAHAPQMDETAHIHKFHRERVKKMKRHQSKFWILSQIVLVLCHISILVIAFLHVIH